MQPEVGGRNTSEVRGWKWHESPCTPGEHWTVTSSWQSIDLFKGAIDDESIQ